MEKSEFFMCVDGELIGFFIRIYRTCIESWLNEGVINHFCFFCEIFSVRNFNSVFIKRTDLLKVHLTNFWFKTASHRAESHWRLAKIFIGGI